MSRKSRTLEKSVGVSGKQPPRLRLWADDSDYAKRLEKNLVDRGYVVHKILTGSEEPLLTNGLIYISGYNYIRLRFL